MTTLSDALSDWLRAVARYNTAAQETERDHGYFLYREREHMANAEGRFLDALIDALEDREKLRRN